MDSIVHEYVVGENQHKNYSFLIDATTSVQAKHIRFYVERNAVLVAQILIASTSIDVHVESILCGEGADAHITGVYTVDGAHKITVTTLQRHEAAHTKSALIMKGVLRDNAHALYHGTVCIEKNARGAWASQENKNILLSNHARAVSVPSLEVLNHDVHCSHGSAVGRFDDEQLFYAASRGLDEKVAQKLLLKAFVADLFTDEMLKNKVNELIGF